MAASSFLQWILQYLRKIFKTGISASGLAWVLRQLGHLRATFLFKLFLWRKGSRPRSSSQSKTQLSRVNGKTEETGEQATPSVDQCGLSSYTTVHNGDIVSLEGIAASSLYPFSNGNIRNTSRSSVRSSQNLSARSRNASRSSRRPESFISHPSAANSVSDMHPIEARPHPAPRRRYSQSTPHLQTEVPARTSNPSPEIELQVMSPGSVSQSNLHFSTNPLPSSHYSRASHSQSRVDEMNTVVSLVTYNPTTLEVPRILGSKAHASSRTDEQVESDEIDHSSNSDIDPPVIPIPARTPSQDAESNVCSIEPKYPNETRRYEERTRMLKRDTEITFPPITLDFSKPAPAGWIRYAHPEGVRYFYNKEKNVYTDAEIYNPKILRYLEQKINELKAKSTEFDNPFPETGEFVVNVYRKAGGGSWMKPDAAWGEAPGVTSPTQFHIELQAQYWYFVQLFPNSRDISKELVSELRDMVLYWIGDSMTSPYSLTPFTLENLHKILALMPELDSNVGQPSPGAMCLFGRKMHTFLHSRFLNFYGESCARIQRDFSVYDDKSVDRRTLLIKTLSLVLFAAPDVHLHNLQKMWVDGMMHRSVWEESMKKMNEEWKEFVVVATVVLNANVAFLAIQTVDVQNHPYRSPAQISSYLSIVANITSIILGLLLMRQNRTKSRETSDEVQKFLNAHNHPRLGLESLAILYSLPYALLMWGMVAFLAAFAFMCFDNANASTRSLVGSACFCMTILIVWCIYVSWEKEEIQEGMDQKRPLAYLEPDNENYDDAYRKALQEDEASYIDRDTKRTVLGQLREFSAKFKRHRASSDAGETMVCGTSGDV